MFKERKQLYENFDKDLIDIHSQRIETKLSLRKQKINEIISKKRLSEYNTILNNENSSKWKLLYNIKEIKLELGDTYKWVFEEDEEMLSFSLKYLKSDKINDIKYSIILLQMFINKHMNNDLTNYINLLYIYDLFHVIERYIKDKEIIFNILYIIIYYSNINTDNNLSTILLSPNSYKIWEICFDLQNYEILYGIIAILNNITLKNQIGSCNLIRSNFLQNKIYNFYMNKNIISQINNNDKKDAINNIINDGIILFCNLLMIPIDNLDRFTKDEIYISKQKILNFVICYSNTNLYKIYHLCIYSIFLSTKSENRLIDELDKINFIQNILDNKKFFEMEAVRYFINNILCNYLAYKNIIKYNLLQKILNFEMEYIKMCDSGFHRKIIFLTLSNMIKCDKNIIIDILKENKFLEDIIFFYKSSCSYSEIKEISYFFGILLFNINNIKQLIEIEKHKLLEIIIKHAKISLQNDTEGLIIIFELLEFYFNCGKEMAKYFEGKNLIVEKFNKLGGKELLDKYIQYENEKLTEQISYILKEYY